LENTQYIMLLIVNGLGSRRVTGWSDLY